MLPLEPPLPNDLRVRFENYPEHLSEIGEALKRVAAKPSPGIDRFERAIWALESTLQGFTTKAREAVRVAQAAGDATALAAAEAELLYMLHSGNPLSYDLSELHDFFRARANRRS